jgi:hypothetical protein
VLRGEREKALAELRAVIDSGWRLGWHDLQAPYITKAMNDLPEWNAMMAELEADISRQREWYETHKDDPLQ